MRRPDRIDRVVELLLGAGLLAAGVYALLRGAGVFGDRRAEDPLVDRSLVADVAANDWWLQLAGIGLGLVLIALGLRWLRSLLAPTPTVGTLTVRAGEGDGTTRVSSGAVTDALVAEVREDPAVLDASARIVDDEPVEISLRVSARDDADVPGLRRRLRQRAVAHLGQALEMSPDDLRVHLHLDLEDPAGGSRVAGGEGLRPAVPPPPAPPAGSPPPAESPTGARSATTAPPS